MSDLVKELEVMAENITTMADAYLASKLKQSAARIEALEAALEEAESKIVWGFYEERAPTYHQGKSGEHELTSPITAEEANSLVKAIELLSN